MLSIPNLQKDFKKICSNISSQFSSSDTLVSTMNTLAKNLYVTVVVTESTASLLSLKVAHLQDLNGNYKKSLISLPAPGTLMKFLKYNYCTENVASALDEFDTCESTLAYSRIVDMDPSSSSYEEMDDLSDQLTISDSKIWPILKPELHHTQPVMMVDSIAHDDRLQVHKDKIKISVIDNQLSVTASGWVNVCRICHGTDSTEELIAPCRCKGSVALAHLSCLERWLKESASSNCELCKQHFDIIRQPKYSVAYSIYIFLTTSSIHGPDLLEDVISFLLYTPSAIFSTYILMLLCDSASRLYAELRSNTAHLIAFFAIAGMAAIDFTYSSWLMMAIQRQLTAWKSWYRETSHLTIVLPPRKRKKLKIIDTVPIEISDSLSS